MDTKRFIAKQQEQHYTKLVNIFDDITIELSDRLENPVDGFFGKKAAPIDASCKRIFGFLLLAIKNRNDAEREENTFLDFVEKEEGSSVTETARWEMGKRIRVLGLYAAETPEMKRQKMIQDAQEKIQLLLADSSPIDVSPFPKGDELDAYRNTRKRFLFYTKKLLEGLLDPACSAYGRLVHVATNRLKRGANTLRVVRFRNTKYPISNVNRAAATKADSMNMENAMARNTESGTNIPAKPRRTNTERKSVLRNIDAAKQRMQIPDHLKTTPYFANQYITIALGSGTYSPIGKLAEEDPISLSPISSNGKVAATNQAGGRHSQSRKQAQRKLRHTRKHGRRNKNLRINR